jgi:8-oxo-dGTP diphosphatase
MSLEGQRPQKDRYTLIPRTLCFLRRDGRLLLVRISESRGAWAGLLNGFGGHIEKGEDPLSAAQREITEEAGVQAINLHLCGVVIVDLPAAPGIGLYVFVGDIPEGQEARPGPEGEPVWINSDDLHSAPLVEDLQQILPRALHAADGSRPFLALYRYNAEDQLEIEFGDPHAMSTF